MANKYSWDDVYAKAKKVAHTCEGWGSLSRAIEMPRRTLRDGLKREFGVMEFSDLLDGTVGDDTFNSFMDNYGDKEHERVTKALLNKQQRLLANRNWIADAIKDAVVSMPEPHVITEFEDSKNDVAMLALFGDWHWGQDTPKQLMGEYQEYSTSVADRRLAEYIHEIDLSIAAATARYGNIDIYFAMLGDMVEGSEIRDTQARVISSGIVTQMLQLFSLLASYIEGLVNKYSDCKFTIIGVPGNHTRLSKTKTDVIPTETMDYAGYNYMMALLRGVGNIHFSISESWHWYDKIQGYGFYFMHGDGIRSYQGLPSYGLTKAGHYIQSSLLVEDKALARDNPSMPASDIRFVDYIIVAHFHTDNMLEDVDIEIVTNGAPVETSPFIAKELRKTGRPSQSILLINEDGVFCKLKKVLK